MDELSKLLPEKYAIYLTMGWVLAQSLGRIYAAIGKGGGLKGIWNGLIFGTNTPKQDKAESGKQKAESE